MVGLVVPTVLRCDISFLPTPHSLPSSPPPLLSSPALLFPSFPLPSSPPPIHSFPFLFSSFLLLLLSSPSLLSPLPLLPPPLFSFPLFLLFSFLLSSSSPPPLSSFPTPFLTVSSPVPPFPPPLLPLAYYYHHCHLAEQPRGLIPRKPGQRR